MWCHFQLGSFVRWGQTSERDVFYRNAPHVWGCLRRIKGTVSSAESDLAVQGQGLNIYVGRGRGRQENDDTHWAGLSFPSFCLFAGWAGPSLLPGLFLVTGGGGCSLAGASSLQSSDSGACGLQKLGPRALEPRLYSCGTRASLLHGRWDLPRAGV